MDSDVIAAMAELSRVGDCVTLWDQHANCLVASDREVSTLYKRVGVKVQLVDNPRSPEPIELGWEDWKRVAMERQQLLRNLRLRDVGLFDYLFELRYAPFPRGKRLTLERLKEQKFGDILLLREKELFKEMIFN
jgi:hypothetical protein